MDQIGIKSVFMRGGTSKGLFFHAADLPDDPAERDRLFLAALGSPDGYGRQLDGLGGGISSLSKVMVVAPGAEGAHAHYTFGQVAVDRPFVDYNSNCGNLSAAIGPFAVDEGLAPVNDGPAELRVFNTNTGKTVINRFEVRDGRAAVSGTTAVDGVSGTGAPVELVFPDPGGAVSGRLLPSGNVIDTLRIVGETTGGPAARPADSPEIEVSLVDATNPVVFVRAGDLGLAGAEAPQEIETDRDLMRRLEAIRRAATVAMGLAGDPDEAARKWASSPKIALVSPPREATLLDGRTLKAADCDLTARVISMGVPHRAVPQTSALCMAVAAEIEGSLVHALLGDATRTGRVRIAHPSGVQQIAADVARSANAPGGWKAREVSVTRTVRRLMAGDVYVPKVALSPLARGRP